MSATWTRAAFPRPSGSPRCPRAQRAVQRARYRLFSAAMDAAAWVNERADSLAIRAKRVYGLPDRAPAMTGAQPSDNGPFHTRAQAEAEFAGFAAAALAGVGGTTPGEQITGTTQEWLANLLADALEARGEQLGAYDLEVIGRLAAMLDPVEACVVGSFMDRVAHDTEGSEDR
jgi:hypothetical protein